MSKARERRLKATGKWFKKNERPENLWYNHIFPIALLISLFFLIYNL
tara:strand:+ start:754 stop:894 length:141 start_codon:yes stop_codon:yes gene_type:complete